MLHCVASSDGFVAFDFHSSLGHVRPIVVAEIERQPFGEVRRVEIRVLALQVNVDMGLAGVAGVAAFADLLPFFYGVAGFHAYAAAFEMGDEQVGTIIQLNGNEVASRRGGVI